MAYLNKNPLKLKTLVMTLISYQKYYRCNSFLRKKEKVIAKRYYLMTRLQLSTFSGGLEEPDDISTPWSKLALVTFLSFRFLVCRLGYGGLLFIFGFVIEKKLKITFKY